ncbi:MAG TPA: alpha-2-macroglobulin, partial [Verrucomicrobiae bacterium]|nr:alpha-2-macroglobulin [Verrucomicrobiae bacterium]
CLNTLAALPPDYEPVKAQAEKLYADGSFRLAHDEYEKAKAMELPAAELRWVDFRLADTLWRSQAATQSADTTQLDRARKDLEVLVRDLQRVEGHDRVWAEVEESLGDYFWTRRNSQSWGEAWPHYQQALDWWAATADIELARQRYLKIVWTIARPPHLDGGSFYYYGYYGNILPLEVLENALKIARTENDKAHAHYLIAMTLRSQGGDWDQRQRVPEDFEAAIKPGKTTDWYDDALYNYAEWMMNNGRVITLKDGGWSQEPDYKTALEMFRRLVKEFKKGETRYYDQAEQQIKGITEPQVQVSVANVFLPDSEIQYSLNWRNVKKIDLALYPVDLTRDVQLAGQDPRRNDWLQSIDLPGREKIKSWSRDTKDKGDYKPGADTVHLDGKLPAGAYILEVRGGGKSSRDLVLVTDASMVLKTSGRQALVYTCNAMNGSPLDDAEVKLWERYYENNEWHWRESSKKGNSDGIAVFDLLRIANNEQIFAASRVKDRQAFSVGNAYDYSRNGQNDPWKIYAFTD